jgi:hypothetical protein
MDDPQLVSRDDANSTQQPSRLDDIALYETLVQWFKDDKEHSSKWRIRAREDFRFVAGKQWSDPDKKKLEIQGRPTITFNRTLPILKSVAGIEVNNRHTAIFLPKQISDIEQVSANDTLNAANKWMADGCDAEDEQSQAFFDALVCGIGCTEGRIDYVEDPDGKYIEDRVYPIEMYWDRAARKKNIVDARRLFRVRSMTLAEARDWLFSHGVTDVREEDIDAEWATEADMDRDPPRAVEERRKRVENAVDYDPKSIVRLVHAQWIELEDYYRIQDPATGQLASVDVQRFEMMRAMMGGTLQGVKMKRKVYREAILGNKLLKKGNSANRDGFIWQFITGDIDSEKGYYFGIVKLLKDPQMWANKWLSQIMHILNTTAKGGILAEAGAFNDIREAQETYARADAITEVATGAISNNKIMPKPGAGVVAGYQPLLEFALNSFRDVTGINMELLGQNNKDQPGIVEMQRKQSAMTILATIFDSLRRFRKINARMRLCYIQDYFSDGRLIRVEGSQEGFYKGVRLLRDKTAGQYEIVIEDAPTSPTQKEQAWAAIQQLMPFLQPFMGNPELALTLVKYSPLPTQAYQELAEVASKTSPIQQRQLQLKDAMDVAAIQEKQAKTIDLKARAVHAQAQADKLHTDATLQVLDSAGALPQIPAPAPMMPGSGPAQQQGG